MSYAAIHPDWEKAPVNMVDGYSLEMTAKETEGLREAAPLIRPGTQIAVTFLPGESLEQRIEATVLPADRPSVPATSAMLSTTPMPLLLARLRHCGWLTETQVPAELTRA